MAHPAVRKVVFPAAGLGTRFLPASKAMPKEMLTLVDRPVIQYGVEEAVAAGLDEVVLVTSRGKSVMEDHFDASPELEAELEKRGKDEALAMIRRLSETARISSVRQPRALGLGHAVAMTQPIVGDQAFAVVSCFPSCDQPTIDALATCVAMCTQDATGLSTECMACTGATVACGAAFCTSQCVSDTNAPICIECRCDNGCTPDFDECTGLPSSGDCG